MKNILGIRYSQWKMIFWLTTNLIFYKENLLSKTKIIRNSPQVKSRTVFF